MIPETHYARAPDGAYIAYQTLGDGPVDILWQLEWIGNVDTIWEHRPTAEWLRGMASFSRLILHDRRATGASSRNVDPPNLESRVADMTAVLDAVGSRRTVLGGMLEGGAPNVVFAATSPERVHSLFWWYPAPRTTRAPHYPYGADEEYLARYRLDVIERWGTDAYRYPELMCDPSDPTPPRWGLLTRQTATPDVALEMDRIYNESDVRGAMPSITAPVLLLAREQDREALDYLSSLLRHPEVRLFPGTDALTTDEQPALLDVIRRFVGIEPAEPELDTFLSTILFTDVVGSTQRQAELGDRRYQALIEEHNAIVRDGLARWHGEEQATRGDGFYATFDGPARAIRCAREIGPRLRELGIEIRAGVHTGECRMMDGEVGGLTVTIGARVAAKAGASEVLVSQTVKDLVAGSGLTFEDAGDHELKGVPDRWQLYRVVK